MPAVRRRAATPVDCPSSTNTCSVQTAVSDSWMSPPRVSARVHRRPLAASPASRSFARPLTGVPSRRLGEAESLRALSGRALGERVGRGSSVCAQTTTVCGWAPRRQRALDTMALTAHALTRHFLACGSAGKCAMGPALGLLLTCPAWLACLSGQQSAQPKSSAAQRAAFW